MSKIPEVPEKPKYNNNNPFRWVDSQWEKFMAEQKELKDIIKNIQTMVKKYPNNFDLGDHIRSYIWELDEKKTYIYESPDGGETVYKREFRDYDNKEEVNNNNE